MCAAGSPLSPNDLAAFSRLGIPPELLAEARLCRVTDGEARTDCGMRFDAVADLSGILFPYYIPPVDYRVGARLRRDHPEVIDGKIKNKYISPYGDTRHLYFPPNAKEKLDDLDVPIVLVESEKAVLALTAWSRRTGVNVIPLGMGGCWGWHSPRAKSKEARNGEREDVSGPISDLNYCNHRRVYVLLDSNTNNNPDVQQARSALVAELQKEKRGCSVLICDLPVTAGVNGPDDLIAMCGDEVMAQFFRDAHEDDCPSEFSDDALALRFTAQHGNDLRYTAAWAKWSRWDGVRWRKDDTLHVFDLARKVCRDAAMSVDRPQLAASITSAKTIAAVERLARADRLHAATVDQWDAHLWLLNTPGGVVDLRAGKLRSAVRRDYMTKITAVAPGGDCPLWRAFLKRIMHDDEELQLFLQRMCGYALTGATHEEALFFLYGTGAKGKSKFVNAIAGLMGDYAKPAPIEMFLDSKNEHHPTDLAGLQGARLVTSIEMEKGRRWAEAKIKALTGGDRIAARYMRQDFFEYTPQFKLVIAGNHKPSLRTVDEATRRRFNLIPFTLTIPEAERDLKLADKLRDEWPGILRWMVDGCLMWQAHGLKAPKAVRDATAQYLAAEDVMARWIEERCVVKGTLWTSSSDLFADWRNWCEENQEFAGSQRAFSQALESRGFIPAPKMTARGFRGICLGSHDAYDASPIYPRHAPPPAHAYTANTDKASEASCDAKEPTQAPAEEEEERL